MTQLSNDHLELTPRPELDGRSLEFDFPGVEIGCAEYDEGPTGCTVFHFPVGVACDYAEGEQAGQGAAFRQLGAAKILVATVVNAVGAIVGRDGTVLLGHLDVATRRRRALVPGVEERLGAGLPVRPPPGHTTLTVVVTNQRLDQRTLRTLGRQVHASMARAIQPFHALVDGDVLYALTTNEVEEPLLDSIGLGVVASELAWDAVLAAVPDAT